MGFMRVSESMLGASERAYCWNAVLEYHCDTAKSFSDAQLAGLAQQAKKQIDDDYIKRSPFKYPGIRKPAAVTVIAIGTRIYIASSVKASNFIMNYGHEKVREALLKTQMKISSTKYHRTQANCGEQAATHLFYTLNPEDCLAEGVVCYPHSSEARTI